MKLRAGNELFREMNRLGSLSEPFVFLVNAFATGGYVEKLHDLSGELMFDINGFRNFIPDHRPKSLTEWKLFPMSQEEYAIGFRKVMEHIQRGDSFLLNYTGSTRVQTNLSLGDLFYLSRARYRVHLENYFTCFSPETFITIDKQGRIASHPMKGTAGLSVSGAEESLMSDNKEIAEHHTIVDLIRNDLSRVASGVSVKKFRYAEKIHTNREDLIQVSSQITGQLKSGWASEVGDIFAALLPAGSVTGAPKPRTIEIITNVESHKRNWYTGVFGIFNGHAVDSGVLIRYVELENGLLVFKSGGGITFQSQCENEYLEMIKKVYVPVA
jgi:para-aminobenzoate synthetase component I